LQQLQRGSTTDDSVQDFDPVLAAFRVFDRDHSSTLSTEELQSYISQIPGIGTITEDDMRAVMDLVDVDDDGVVSLADFRSFITAGLTASPKTPERAA
jgi:Ca2+-binding EF-hand superfamily protein